jgi:hypothetical protein
MIIARRAKRGGDRRKNAARRAKRGGDRRKSAARPVAAGSAAYLEWIQEETG